MIDTKNNPEIRFKGFFKEWSSKELTELVKRISIQSNSNNLPKVEFEDIISSEGRLNKKNSEKLDKRKGIHFKENDVLYGKLRPYLNNWLHPDFEGIALGDFWVFRAAENISSNFVYSLIQSERYQRAANLTSGTKMPRSDWDYVSSTLFPTPSDFEEQQKIGSLFKIIDNLISTQGKQVHNLEQYKKSMLQKMFPKADTWEPEIRFEGFNGKWKVVKLGQIFKDVNKRTTINNQHEILTSTSNDGIQLQSEYFNKQIASKNNIGYKVVRRGDLVFSPQNIWLGNINLNTEFDIGIVSPSYKVMELQNNFDSNLMYDYIRLPIMLNKYAMVSEQGASVVRRNLNYDEFKDLKVKLPSYEEQKAIGAFFKTLNKQITEQKRIVEECKTLKQGLLQKMFV